MPFDELSTENEAFISHQISIGIYRDRNDAIETAISLLRARADIFDKLDVGKRALDAGEYVSMDEAELRLFFEGMKQRIRNRATSN